MSDHGGQMPGGTLDVTELWVTEPAGADAPAEAIPEGGDFSLHMKFSGSGTQWGNMKDNEHLCRIVFHLEGIGGTEDEVDYTAEDINLSDQDEYEVQYDVTNNTLVPGLYRCGCTVENLQWNGAVAFWEGLILHIYEKKK